MVPSGPAKSGILSGEFWLILLDCLQLTRKQKVTEFYFNEHDDLAEIYTHNTDLKKRLLAYAKEYPELCQLTEDDEQGGLRFEIDKRRIGIRLILFLN